MMSESLDSVDILLEMPLDGVPKKRKKETQDNEWTTEFLLRNTEYCCTSAAR